MELKNKVVFDGEDIPNNHYPKELLEGIGMALKINRKATGVIFLKNEPKVVYDINDFFFGKGKVNEGLQDAQKFLCKSCYSETVEGLKSNVPYLGRNDECLMCDFNQQKKNKVKIIENEESPFFYYTFYVSKEALGNDPTKTLKESKIPLRIDRKIKDTKNLEKESEKLVLIFWIKNHNGKLIKAKMTKQESVQLRKITNKIREENLKEKMLAELVEIIELEKHLQVKVKVVIQKEELGELKPPLYFWDNEEKTTISFKVKVMKDKGMKKMFENITKQEFKKMSQFEAREHYLKMKKKG